MECVVKVTAGPEAGQSFRCTAEETIFGRSPRCAVRLAGASISYEHAILSRIGEEFFLENLSANGTFLNNERITGKTRVRARDQFRLGDETMVRVESLPAGNKPGTSRRYMLLTVVLLLIALLVVVAVDPFSGASQKQWTRAYQKLQEFTQREAAAGHLPPNTPTLLQDAWRLESAGDRADAAPAWIRLRVLLASSDAGKEYESTAQQFPGALNALLTPDPKAPPPTDDDNGAALIEFVTQMTRRK